MHNYSYNVFWSQDDEAYIATSPEFEGLSAFGGTPEAAIAEMKIVLRMAIKTYEEDHWPIPEPRVQTGRCTARGRRPATAPSKLLMDINEIRSKVTGRPYGYSIHADEERNEEGLDVAQVRTALLAGQILWCGICLRKFV